MTRVSSPLHLQGFLPYQLSILQNRVSAFVGAYYKKHLKMSRNEWRAMAALAQHGERSAKEIGHFVQLEKMPVSRALKALVSKGYVQQSTDAEDKRLSRLELTPEGVNIYQDILPHVLKGQDEVLAVLSEKEQQDLEYLLEKLLRHTETLVQD